MLILDLMVSCTDKMHMCLYSRVSTILCKLGLMKKEEEYAYDMGLIVGGSDTQPIHYDVPINACKDGEYQRVMALPYAPASILLGLDHCIRLTVGRDKNTKIVDNEDGSTLMSYIDDDAPTDKRFTVVSQFTHVNQINDKREEREVATLESKHGFIFRGDFYHGGAPIVKTAGVELATWTTVLGYLRPLLPDQKKHNPDYFKRLFPKLCNVPSLNTITRLHVQLLPLKEDVRMPEDEIGFDWGTDSEKEGDDPATSKKGDDDDPDPDGLDEPQDDDDDDSGIDAT